MPHVVVVSGKAGSGKTTWARNFVRAAERLIVVDTTGEWEVGGEAAGVEECLRRIRALRDVPRFRLACRVTAGAADDLLRAVWLLQHDPHTPARSGLITLVVEEADLVPCPRDSGLDLLIQVGRRVADPLVLCTRRLARLTPDARSNADFIVFFSCDEPDDLDAIRRRKGREVMERVRALSGHQYVTA